MAIIVVEEIPKPVRPQKTEPFDYRGKVKTDLLYAYNERIAKFEFVGYNSVASASQYAREEAYKLIYEKVYKPVGRTVEEALRVALKKKLGKATKYIRLNFRRNSEPAIVISGVTVNGVKRLFGEINWEYIDNFASLMTDKFMKEYSKPEVIKELKDRLAREKAHNAYARYKAV